MSKRLPVSEVQPLPGHIGNLNQEQNAKLAEMWGLFFSVIDNPDKAKSGKIAADAGNADDHLHGLSKDDKDKAIKSQHEEQESLKALFKTHGVDEFYSQFWFLVGPDAPDMVMLKFLRARKWNVHRAFAMLANCVKWRIESNVIDLLYRGDEGMGQLDDKYLMQLEAEKTYATGATDDLMPLIYINVKRHLAKAQGPETMTRLVILSAESFRTLMTHPSDKIVIVFDLTGFGWKNMDWHTLTSIMKILEAYYPETLRKLYIHNAPWIFQGIWKGLRPLLDPNVRDKIEFSKNARDLDLVPKNRLLSHLGGDLVSYPEYIAPSSNENTSRPVGDPQREKAWQEFISQAKNYEQATKEWEKSNGQDAQLQSKRELAADKLRLAWLDLDPLVRGKNNYHRAGILRADGTRHWEYKQKDGTVLTHILGEDRSRSALQKRIGQSDSSSESQSGNQQRQNDGASSQQEQPSSSYDSNQQSDPNQHSAEEFGAASAGVAGVGAGAAGAAAYQRSNTSSFQQSYEPGMNYAHSSDQTQSQNPAYSQGQGYDQGAYASDAYDPSMYQSGGYDQNYTQDTNEMQDFQNPHEHQYNASNGNASYNDPYANHYPGSSNAYQQQGYTSTSTSYPPPQNPNNYPQTATDAAMGAGAGMVAGAALSAGAGVAAGATLGAGAALGAGAGYAMGAHNANGNGMTSSNSLSYLRSYLGSQQGGGQDHERSSMYSGASAQNSSEDLFIDAPGEPMDIATEQKQPKQVTHDGAEGYDLTHGRNFELEDGVEADANASETKNKSGAHMDFAEQIAEGGMTAHGSEISKEKSPLAGFPNYANGGGAQNIAEANRRARESQEKARKKQSFISKLNCCGGSSKHET
ncbi:hypothetical protein MPSI1_002741 [Malassezia psittaci]|uniref:CRAL-TRIO domain-containing protein n=1 Tax=Malassezia psittaci TaxID=1821823 RepID=A0AAF0F6M6_9BASI|nr:hypothetical protein MPSI1_002741 [Malassezia psittaci]